MPAMIGASRVRRRRGAALIYIAVAMTVLIGFMSLGVDVGHVQMVKSQLQIAAEAAARAGARKLSQGSSAAEVRGRLRRGRQ